MQTVSLPHPGKLLALEPLDHPNPYDHRHAHRHDYFEVILVSDGQGHQYIDDERHGMSGGDLFVIYPGQVHLMHRNTAMGHVIQFRKGIFMHLRPLKHHQLFLQRSQIHIPAQEFSHLMDLVVHMRRACITEGMSPLAIHRAYDYLSILLITLIEHAEAKYPAKDNEFSGRFLALLGEHIRHKRKVADYADLLACSTDTLNRLCMASFGKAPLKLIHEELVMEARRQMLLNRLSLKQISHLLNFDSTANFSTFVRKHTGRTPTALKAAMMDMHAGDPPTGRI